MDAFPPVQELLPHRGPAVLLDAVLEDHADGIRATTRITSEHPYFVDGAGVPAWVGIEIMAQAIAAHAGLEVRRAQKAPNAGMLLGTRRYQAETAYFPAGMQLEVTADREFGESGGVAACACRILAEGRTLVTATLIVVELDGGKMP